MPDSAVAQRHFPYTAQVGDARITLRLMTPEDREAFLAFMRAQPEDDLFFLLVDVTTPEGLGHWMGDLEQGRNITVLAEEDGKLLGYSSLHHGQTRWTRHLGEIRLLVASGQRGRGVGRLLGHEVFSIAHDLDLQRIVVRVASGQMRARRLFERLGFHMEALLADWVIDRQGRTQDLVLMSYDVAGFHG
ncbi:MAG TPA: GNAT family protein [Bryobacteraceae bacterium]|nr:GNAT family protein [Bryobacteraceae bacterium]